MNSGVRGIGNVSVTCISRPPGHSEPMTRHSTTATDDPALTLRDLVRQEQISARKVARNQLLRAGFARKLPEPTAHDGARKALQINAFVRRASNRSQLGKLMFCH